MKKKLLFTGMLVMTMALGMLVVGCDTGTGGNSDGSSVDTALNGTWLDGDGYEALKCNNGNYESGAYRYSSSMDGDEVIGVIDPAMKGTYSTSNGKLTTKTTHVHGDFLRLDSKWYSKSDLEKVFKDAGVSSETLDMLFLEQTIPYSISGNKLTITVNGESITYTKK